MNIWLLRHGRTAYNGEGRYQGRTDVPLSPEGAEELERAEITPPVVVVSPLVIVAHGGVQMAVMERFALPERGYFDWNVPCGGGYVLEWEKDLWRSRRKLRLLREVRYTKGGDGC